MSAFVTMTHDDLVERIVRLLAMFPALTNAQIRSVLLVNAFELKAALDTLRERGIVTSVTTWSLVPGVVLHKESAT